MAQRSRFWDGTTIGDATVAPYDAGTEFSEVMTAVAGLSSDPNKGGLLGTLSVSMFAPGTMRIGPFEALAYGAWYQNDANIDIPVSTPASATRIDTVVLRKDWAAQTVRVLVINGAEGGSTPPLVQTPGVTWDVPIATISTTTGGVTTITPTNTRADFWYRTSPTGIRTNNNIGVGINASPNNGFGISVAPQGFTAPASYGMILDNRYDFGSNIAFDGTNWLRVDVSKPAFWADGNSVFPFTMYYAPAGANPIGAPYTSPLITLGSTGQMTVFPTGTNRGVVVGDLTGGGAPAQQRYVSISHNAKSGAGANAAGCNIEFAAPNPNSMGIDFHVPNVAKWGGIYMIGAGNVYLGVDIGWGFPQVYLPYIMNFGFGRIYSSTGTPFIDGQTGGFLLMGGGHSGGNAISVAPATHNATHLGWGDRGWALVHSVGGLVQDSLEEDKQGFSYLDPNECVEAVLNTDWLAFEYKPPTDVEMPVRYDGLDDEQWEQFQIDFAERQQQAALARKQRGYVLGSDTYRVHKLFGMANRETAGPQSDLATLACALQAALKQIAELKEKVN